MTNIREIKRTSLMNVPQRLRELADEIERQGLPTAIVVIGYPEGYVAVRGFGERTSALEATGWLHRALDAMTDGSRIDTDMSGPKGAA
jgi:hypothetical protein